MDKSSEYVICMKMRQTDGMTTEKESVWEKGCRGSKVRERGSKREQLTFHDLLLSLCDWMPRIKLGFCEYLIRIHIGDVLKQLCPRLGAEKDRRLRG